ncbi:hypothetical protein [Salmonirosea aquatica]|uniref:Uncharacterized protein n=1 Tax=Salmonirosea aquatica TaxID=2654236 RepID=A0A7C9BLK5_9BACT|nr:hypothetical protein [Cytophagaceae bacterium SJW1-29]
MKLNLSEVSERLLAALANACQSDVVYHGQAQAVYHQGDGRNRLMTLSDPIKMVGIEGKAQTQLAWLAETLVGVEGRSYGTGGTNLFTATVSLLVLSRQSDTLGVLLQVLSGSYDVQVTGVDMNTLRVIREGWLVDVGKDKNYDPALLAWNIRCRINNVQLVKDC